MQVPDVVNVHVARERILRTAYDLFARRGLWDVNMTRMENAYRSLAMAREEVV